IRVPDLAAMLRSLGQVIDYGGVRVWPWQNPPDLAELDTLLDHLRRGVDMSGARARIENQLRLTLSAFMRIMEVRKAEAGYEADPQNALPVSNEAWDEVRAILVSVDKAATIGPWVEEEARLRIAVGPADFWPRLATAMRPALPRW